MQKLLTRNKCSCIILIKKRTFIFVGGINMRRLRIVNKMKFIQTNVVIIMLLILFVFSFINMASSNTSISYKVDYIVQGETLWDIAKREAEMNKYYEGADIRDIVYNLREINHLENANVTEGVELKIPSYSY